MIIHSKVKDYYDGVVSTMRDDSIHWTREPKQELIQVPKTFKNFIKTGIRYQKGFISADEQSIAILGYCGKFYPYVITYDKETEKHNISYEREDIITFLLETGWTFQSDKKNRLKYERMLDDIYNLFDNDMFIKYNTPIIEFAKWSYNTKDEVFAKINPILKDLYFYRVRNSWEAMKDLDAYFSCILTRVPDIPEPSNDIKISAAGFDLKLSFRKTQTKKRKKKNGK